MECEACQFLNQAKPLLETDHWIVTLAEDQYYLGRCYVTAKRHVPSLADLTQGEFNDMQRVIQTLEHGFRHAFSATMFNWTCLMNNAYKEASPNPHVHWHFRPRYSHIVEVNGELFEDKEFAHHYDRKAQKIVDSATLEVIRIEFESFLENKA